jgi:UDP-glucose 4-epimerase
MLILITGGFGFIGGRLAQYLHKAGYQILLGSRNEVQPAVWLPEVKVVKTDWRQRADLKKICKGVDVIIHAAGMNAQDSVNNPVAALEFNGLATLRLVEAARSAGVKRFLYLSTAHVYASPLVGSITEESCPRNLHPYATSHLAGENAVLGATQRGEIEGLVLRLSNVYGVPSHKDVNCWMLLVNDLCRQVIETGTIVLKTKGIQYRDFIDIKHVCEIIEKLISCGVNSQLPSIINVGTGTSYSVYAMAKLIQRRCYEILYFKPNIMRLKSVNIENNKRLKYKSNELIKLGVYQKVNNVGEIDRLLLFCKDMFEKIK